MKLLMALIVAVSCLIGFTATAQEAPLGLTWSAPSETLRQAGIELSESTPDSYGTGFSARKIPKALADQDVALLSFGHNDKLWRMAIISKEFPNDPMGIAVRNRYDDLLATLSEKYGKPKSYHTLGGSIYSEARYFLAGVQGGQSFWYSNFNTAELAIQIGIFATSSSEARWRIIYEYKPLRAIFDQSKKGKEKGAL